MTTRILAINPGSTSTKIALYEDEQMIFSENITHSQEEIEKFPSLLDQIAMRKDLVLRTLAAHGISVCDLSGVVGRGGMFPPLKTGGYRVNDKMLAMILNEEIPTHASNLGAVLAHEIALLSGAHAFIYDAVSAADFPPIAKITGIKEVERKSYYHVLNTRAAGIRYAHSVGKPYADLNLLIAHLGGGITVGVHRKGRIVDSISDDNGPFAPERAGSLPLMDVIELCYSGKYTKEEMIKNVRGLGGLRNLLGTSDGRRIMRMIDEGDAYASLVMQAQAYQVAKGIGLLSPVLKGDCDAIILTGGLAHDTSLTAEITDYVSFIAPVVCLLGEFETEALALGGLRILRGEETAEEM
jgi:butyrate kinase